MLVNKQLKTGDIVSVLLTTGQEIIATYHGSEGNSVLISKPRTPMHVPAAAGQPAMAVLAPIMNTANPDDLGVFPFENSKILHTFPTLPEVAKAYDETINPPAPKSNLIS